MKQQLFDYCRQLHTFLLLETLFEFEHVTRPLSRQTPSTTVTRRYLFKSNRSRTVTTTTTRLEHVQLLERVVHFIYFKFNYLKSIRIIITGFNS